MKDWNLLRDRKIIDLMIGDRPIPQYSIFEYKMPYMRGIDICNFSNKFGLVQDLDKEKKSRWQYMDELLKFVTENNKINLFFKEFIDLKRFREVLDENDFIDSIHEQYWNIIHSFFQEINKQLTFDKCHIEYDLQTYQFNLIDDENEIELITEKIDNLDQSYIKRLKDECYKVILDGDFDSAITKSRTMLEEVMIKGIENKNEKPSESGNINKLYNQFKDLYQMHINKEMDTRIKTLLSGFEKIITSIAQMRDKNSDSHGVGEKRINIQESHAILFVNSSITMSNFLLSIINE